MFTSMLGPHTRTILTALIVGITLVFLLHTDARCLCMVVSFFLNGWKLPGSEVIGKTWGAAFAFCPNYTFVKFSIIRRGGSRSRRKSTRVPPY